MRFYRLIKPLWALPKLDNGEDNPNFVRAIEGPKTIEGPNFTAEYLTQKNQEGYHVYFFPNHPSSDVYQTLNIKYISGKHIDTFKYVFIDMDLKDGVYASKEAFLEEISKFKIKPTMTVDSGNGIHVYWAVQPVDRKSWILTQWGLINKFKTDESVWTPLQLMRMPGFNNTKDINNFKQVQVLKDYSSGQTYNLVEIAAEVKDLVTQEHISKTDRHIDRLEGRVSVDLGTTVNINDLPDRFLDLLETKKSIKEVWENPKLCGDRSKADMRLANILYSEGFDIKEAVIILSNTQKALEKGSHARAYAENTVAKVYGDRPKHKFQNAAEYLKSNKDKVVEKQILGPYYLDYGVLGEPWRRNELLGLIGGSGIGKTAMALNVVEHIIFNNQGNDDVFVFFSLEMTKEQILNRWVKQVGEGSPLTERLYVIDRNGDDGLPINIGLQEIYEYCKEIKQVTGKHIGAIIIDHFHIVSTHIDTRIKPNWGIESEQGTGNGVIRNLSLNALATQLKALVRTLNSFGILLSQTTKEKGVGDKPLGKDAAYGVSQYEWIVDRIITMWQPLMRVQELSQKRFLAFQYAKIREKTAADSIKEYDPKLLRYDLTTGRLEIPRPEDYQEFCKLLPIAMEKQNESKDKNVNPYSIQGNLSNNKTLTVIQGGK